MLLMHGWPGSFLEFEGLIGPLTDPVSHGGEQEDAFDVVIVSHPGFGFSTPLVGADWKRADIARAYLELMSRLGYERFAVQGGDVGAGVAPEIARLAPERVIGVHVNGSLGTFVGQLDEETAARLTPLEQDRLRRVGEFIQKEFGYIAIQSTRPALIGAMTADSPVGQFAWILDKLQAWTHPAEVPAVDLIGERFIIENASLYWFTSRAARRPMWVMHKTRPGALSRRAPGCRPLSSSSLTMWVCALPRRRPTTSCAGPTSKAAEGTSPPSKNPRC